jgi:hypothetical protein
VTPKQRAEALAAYFDWDKDSEQVREITKAIKEAVRESLAAKPETKEGA